VTAYLTPATLRSRLPRLEPRRIIARLDAGTSPIALGNQL
jgi:hypothetical protein